MQLNLDLNKNTALRETHIRLLDALKDICDRHKLVYWIDFGTLLGAHLDGYFIPWDDDIDVSMPIEDYRKFLEIAEKELPSDIFLQIPKTDPGYKQYFAKLRDCYSTLLEHRETGLEPYHHGVYIDIFPSVYYPHMAKFFRKVLTFITLRTRYAAFVNSHQVFLNYPVYILCKTIWFLLSPLKSKNLAQTPEDNGYYYVIPDSYVYPLQQITFAGKKYPAPLKIHEYLTIMYKRYTATPPMETRVSHSREILMDTPCNHPRAMKRGGQTSV